MKTKVDDELMTKKQVAERYTVSVRTVERMAASGKIRAIRIRGCVRFRRSDVDSLINW